jgi:uncharacterized membrane protein
MRWRRRLQLAAVVLVVAVYSGLSHYSNSIAKTHDLGVALSLAPILTVGLLLVLRWTHWTVTLLFAAVAAWGLSRYWPLLEQNFADLYLLQEGGFYTLMAASFGQSLRPGGISLCTQLADRIHGPLSSAEVQYTRSVTLAWALFFLSLAAATVGLYEFAPLRVWSFFANFCAIPLIALMFVAEYAVRRRVLPQQRRSILDSVRVYFASPG